jgi:DNA-binding response OmpR family regulator
MVPQSEKLQPVIVAADPFVRSQFAAAAEITGLFAEPHVAEDAYDAMALLWDWCEAGRLPDIIVADFDLGDMNAVQFACELRRHAETRVIVLAILSLRPTELDRIAAETAGADYFLQYVEDGSDLLAHFTTLAQKLTREGARLITD